MYEELAKQLETNGVDLDNLGAYYWNNLRESVIAAVNHAENGNQLGTALTLGVAREMVSAIDGLLRLGKIPSDFSKAVDKK